MAKFLQKGWACQVVLRQLAELPADPPLAESAIQAAAAQLLERGWAQPLVLDPSSGAVLQGLELLAGARRLGLTVAPVRYTYYPKGLPE